jgi:hypothetical protein
MFNDCGFPSLSVAEHGSDIRNPVAGWTPLVGTSTNPQSDLDEPLTLCARGRSNDGRKSRLFLWGMVFARTVTWLLTPGSGTDFATFLSRLNSDSTFYLSISGLLPVWRDDFTINYNDHAIKVERP